MPIIGTAGHVDHGKSTLVEALTGRDPDRWAEEKSRGLTIDLGFAWTELAPGITAGFVDVPGHERFMKNMLAGVGAVDVSLFVVAADEGWMPQSEEHMSVLDLLDVRHGVIALTRVDLADDDTRELAELELADRVEGTTMERWPIVPVSAVTGEGIDALRTALLDQLEEAGPPADSARPRLWVDRSFVISGAGVVVTGTLTGGEITVGDTLELLPGPTVRVRGLQSHERPVEVARPGTRTAVNLSGVEREEVVRGSLLAGKGQERMTRRVLAAIRTVRSYDEGIGARGAYHLHAGTGSWPARLRPIGTDLVERSGSVLVALDGDVPAAMGDRFILREVGRRAVVAGGRVLDPSPRGRMAGIEADLQRLLDAVDGSPDEKAQALLETRGSASLRNLGTDSGGGRPAVGLATEETAVTTEEAGRIAAAALRVVSDFHSENPLRAGMPRASLASRLGVAGDVLDAVLRSADDLIDDAVTVRSARFSDSLGAEEEAEWERAVAVLTSAGFAAPRAEELGLDGELLHALVRSGRLVQVAPGLVYLPDTIEAVTRRLDDLSDGFTVAEFRDALGVSRRQAVPLLEFLDAGGYTRRDGNVRVVRRRPGPGGSSARPR